MSENDALVAFWCEGAAERERLMREAGQHGTDSQARRRLLRKDGVLCGRMMDVGDELERRELMPAAKDARARDREVAALRREQADRERSAELRDRFGNDD